MSWYGYGVPPKRTYERLAEPGAMSRAPDGAFLDFDPVFPDWPDCDAPVTPGGGPDAGEDGDEVETPAGWRGRPTR